MDDAHLSPRELQILMLVADGLPNKDIARRLGISRHTVKSHLARAYEALGAHNRTTAVTAAMRAGLLALHCRPGAGASPCCESPRPF